jgi:hypothetical protein
MFFSKFSDEDLYEWLIWTAFLIHFLFLNLIILIIWGKICLQIKKLLILVLSPLSYHFLPLVSTLFQNIRYLYSSLCMRDLVLFPYVTTGKILILYVWIFMCLRRKCETTRREWYQGFPNLISKVSFYTCIYKIIVCFTSACYKCNPLQWLSLMILNDGINKTSFGMQNILSIKVN